MMKKCKILGTAAAMMLVLALAGCENNTDDVDALKKRVDQMEQELADMEINNNLAESSQDKASINEVSASDDSIASLTQAVDDMVSKANEAKPDGTEEEKMEQFFTLKKEMKSMDSRLDAYEDYLEYQYRQEKLSREEYQSQDQALEELESGSFGVREPSLAAPQYNMDLDGQALCLVPGLCFDNKGYRLGYGKGYYDRFLAKFRGVTLGLCYNDFLQDCLPVGDYDLPVQQIATENRVFTVEQGAAYE